MTRYYPVFLDLTDRLCVVVGGGPVAARKAAALRDAGARVRLIAPDLDRTLEEMAAAGQIDVRRRPYRPGDLAACALAIAATDRSEVNRAVSAEARRRSIPCNVVDSPALCTFIVPSLLRRGELVLALSTGGASPALCRRLRRELEARIGPEYAPFLELLRQARRRLQREVPERAARRRALHRLVSSAALEQLRAGRPGEARATADAILADALRAASPAPQALPAGKAPRRAPGPAPARPTRGASPGRGRGEPSRGG